MTWDRSWLEQKTVLACTHYSSFPLIRKASALVQRANALLDNEELQAIYPDNPKDPNDPRHRLRTRLLEAQALVAWAQGQPARAQAAFQAALPLITFAVGAEGGTLRPSSRAWSPVRDR